MQTVTQPYCHLLRRGVCALLLVLIITTGTSCKRNFSSDTFEDDKLVILAEITAGDSVKIPIGKTIKVEDGSLIRFEKVNDATLTLTEANSQSWVLTPNYSAAYASNPTSVFTNRKRFKANTAYTIEINHPTLGTVQATTTIPALPRLLGIDTSTTFLNNNELLAADVNWQDVADKDDLYIIEVLKEMLRIDHFYVYQNKRYSYDTKEGKDFYDHIKNTPGTGNLRILRDTVSLGKYTRINLYTQDLNSDNSKIDKLVNPFRRVFFTDLSFNGQSFSTRVYIDKQFFVNAQQPGRIRVQLKSVSKELFSYLELYEKYKTDFGLVPTTQLVSPTGNITKGLGIFGGSAKREKVLYFDSLQ